MKIGLTYTGTPAKHDKYKAWLAAGSGDIEIIGLFPDHKQKGYELFASCDALVLSGGIDMLPDYYKGEARYPNMPEGFDIDRDEFEWNIFGAAWERAVPVLGICRGLQLINCYFGGDLFQDAGEPANSIHRSFKKKENQYDRAHGINVDIGSLLGSVGGVARAVVNSAHHQSVRKLGEGLMINAFSDDDVVEGIELADKTHKPFFLAVQWHPERMTEMSLQTSPFSKNIRDRFIKEIKSSR
jgi:putative glutamine amidotransferase